MTVNSILDSKFDAFKNQYLQPFPLELAMIRATPNKPELYRTRISEFVNSFNLTNREYILRKFLDWLNNYKLEEKSFHQSAETTEEKAIFLSSKFGILKEDFLLELQNISDDLNAEMFNNEEWEELKSKIDTISEQLVELIKRNNAGQELIYDSVEEIKEELLSKAESGRIFGKEFVTQQLSGKILDMAFKGSFFAMLSKSPENLIDLSNHIKSIM